ncbi:MAG: PVC-type heme-binding CxxCH protein, partial [Halioglobus sp.]
MAKKPKWLRILLWSTGSILGLVLVLVVGTYFVAVVGIGGASLQEGMQMTLYTDEHIEHIPVALDITPDGTIFVAQTAQFGKGVGDNRQQSFWLADDQSSNSSADREAYIEKWIKAGEFEADWFTQNADYITRIQDTDGDGLADTANTFAERRGRLVGLTSGVLVKGKDVWITSIPDVVKYHDRNGDGQASEDETEVLSSGYGFRANFLGHDMHGLTWGPDGKIYYSLGDRGYNVHTREGKHLQPPIDNGRGAVFRMNPDGSELEVFATGLRNPQEIAFDNYGNLFTGDNNSDGGDKARIVYVVEGGDSGWMSPYQFQADEDYLRGPWNAEKLWHPRHKGQPAWIVPPIANLASGPSGMAFYPGLGLPDRYKEHFFLADYVFAPVVSHLWSFAVTPEGAGFEIDDAHKFATNKLFIDQVFGYDGALYTLSASTFGDNRAIHKMYQETPAQPQLIAEVQSLFQQGFEQLENTHLQQLLGHADQRVRREAQFELAAREQVTLLAAVAHDTNAELLPRIHAVWGLGQTGQAGLQQAGWQKLSWLDGQPTELRAQVLKV